MLRKWTKRAVFGFVGLVLSLLVFYKCILPLILTTEWAKQSIEQRLSQELGRSVTLRPELKVSWTFMPSLSLGDIEIGNPKGMAPTPLFLRLKSASVDFDVWSLARGAIFLPSLNFQSGEISLQKNEQGMENWKFTSSRQTDSQPTTEGQPWIPSIGVITLENIQINYSNIGKAQTTQGAIQKLTLRGLGGADKLRFASTTSYESQFFDLGAESDDLLNLLQGKEWPLNLDLRQGGQELKFTGQINLSDKSGPNVKGKLRLGGKDPVELFHLLRVKMLPAISAYSLEGEFHLRPQGLDYSIEKAQINSILLSSKGQLGPSFREGKLFLSLSGADLDSYLLPLGVSLPSPVKQFGVKGEVALLGNLYQIQLEELSLDDFKASAKVGVAPDGRTVRGEVSAKNIDLRKFFQPSQGGGGKSGGVDTQPSLLSDAPIHFSLLNDRQGDISVDLKDVQVDDSLSLQRLSGRIQIANGELDLSNVEAKILEGTVLGSAKLAPTGSRVLVDANNLPLKTLLSHSGVVGGFLHSKISLHGRGESLKKFASSLVGSFDLRLHHLELEQGGLAFATSNLFEILNPLSKGKSTVKLDCSISRFLLKDGIAQSEALVAKISDVLVLGQGTIDLRNEELSIGIVPRSKSVGVSTIVPPVKIFGSLLKPNVVPNPLGLATAQIDNVQGVLFGGLDAVTEIGKIAGVVGREQKQEESPYHACEKILEANNGKVTTLVGNLVSGL